jgi:hypothetical protein
LILFECRDGRTEKQFALDECLACLGVSKMVAVLKT